MPINNFTMKSQAISVKKFRSETKLVMPESRLRPLTFASFLPTQFQTIAEDEGDESDSGLVYLEPYETGSYQAARRLQFLEEDSSSQPKTLEKPAYEGNREVKQGYGSSEVLIKVASAIGKPLYTNRFTAIMARILYARVLVETDVSQPLLDSIETVTPTRSFQKAVEYDCRPKFCNECMKLGHCAEAYWSTIEGKQAEEKQEEPQFQEVKKKKRRNKRQIAPQPRYDYKARRKLYKRGQLLKNQIAMKVQARIQITNSYNVLQEAGDPGEHSQPSMIISTWNIRGLNQTLNKKELRLFMKKNKVDVIGVVETRVKVHKTGNILQKMVIDWKHCLKYPMSYNGRVWLLWKDHIQIHVLVVHE
ncbi:hypothetical protein KY290_010752 [Solanum tuberosum]|uniref:Endonuclease/exonuclease/phosphatase n=1 Tax=Solanum tuberosum TaxID=4113 RepID=A0ABQ7VZ63_SOLTU|nr:hypothetical protein KY290_010752 [Solanum tuberosum]